MDGSTVESFETSLGKCIAEDGTLWFSLTENFSISGIWKRFYNIIRFNQWIIAVYALLSLLLILVYFPPITDTIRFAMYLAIYFALCATIFILVVWITIKLKDTEQTPELSALNGVSISLGSVQKVTYTKVNNQYLLRIYVDDNGGDIERFTIDFMKGMEEELGKALNLFQGYDIDIENLGERNL